MSKQIIASCVLVLLAAACSEDATGPDSGAVAVSAPFPASILLDGTPTGRVAPDTLTGLEPGEHVIALELAGFVCDPSERRVNVTSGGMVAADFDLRAAKRVCCEFFVNYGSFLCVSAETALWEAMDLVGAARVVAVSPHVNYPGGADPMYHFNVAANDARIIYNQVNGTPTTLIDGAPVPQVEIASASAIKARIENALAVEPPVALGVHEALTGTAYEVTVDLWGVASAIPADLTLFTCVIEREVVIDSPGQNGQTQFLEVLRELFPPPVAGGTGGEALGAIAASEHRQFTYTYELPAGVDPAKLAAAAFVQRPSPERTVVQAGASF